MSGEVQGRGDGTGGPPSGDDAAEAASGIAARGGDARSGGGGGAAETARRGPRGAADRVPRSHAQTRATLRVALAFMVAAALTGLLGGSRWAALHLFLAGAMVLAISGVSLMLTVTWSAAPAPPNRWVVAQRVCIAIGAVGVVAGRSVTAVPAIAVAVAAALYMAGLVLLLVLLVITIRRGVERRFDAAVAAYLAAFTAGIIAIGLAVLMVLDSPTPALRAAHVAANLLGLVGLTAGGTLPFFASTVVRSRMSPRATPRRLIAVLCWQVATLLLIIVALAVDARTAAAVGFTGYAIGILAVLALVPPPTRRQFQWAGPRMIALWLGGAWWVVAVSLAAVHTAAGEPGLSGPAVAVLVFVGYGQILWGSLAYLLPMLRGGGHVRLGAGFATTRSWPGLVAVNVAGLALLTSLDTVAALAIAVWVVDAVWRAGRVGIPGPSRPNGETT